MEFSDVLDGLGLALAGIAGLRFYGYPADRVEPPAVVVPLPSVVTLTAKGGSFAFRFPLWVLVSKANDKAGAKELLPYLDPRNARSIQTALEADKTLGGRCDSLSVTAAEPEIATLAGTEYFAVEFTMEVIG